MPSKGKYHIPEHVYTPKMTRQQRYGTLDGTDGMGREQPKLLDIDECVHCKSSEDTPWSTYLYRFSPEKHLFSSIIEEEP